jgi:hypothetical protein
MSEPKFIRPEDYTPGMGEVAKISIENAERLKQLSATQDDRILQMKKWLEEDAKRGFIAEDIDED